MYAKYKIDPFIVVDCVSFLDELTDVWPIAGQNFKQSVLDAIIDKHYPK